LTSARQLYAMGSAAVIALLAGTSPAQAQLARELGLIPAGEPVPTASFLAALPTESNFALEQLRFDRVREARLHSRHNIKRDFHERGISYPAAELFIRVFKRERSLELWVRSIGADRFELLKTYPICALAGELGPKRRQGDNQTPEGFYSISFFNPRSEFHLSLHIDYPNRRDRAAGLEGLRLGGDIYIHGGCSSEGCVAITDDGIRELYWLSVEARSAGQHRIPVHIFPARMDDRDYEILKRAFATRPDLTNFWSSIKPGFDFFEQHRRLPNIAFDSDGAYVINGAPQAPPGGQRRAQRGGRAPLGAPLGAPVGEAVGTEPATEQAPPTPAPPGARRPLGAPAGGG
jgi:murein L,D-transpeptidase YafK